MERDMPYLENNELTSKIKIRTVGNNQWGLDIPIGAYIIDVRTPKQLYNIAVTGDIKILTKGYHDVTDEFITKKEGEPIPPTADNLFKVMAMVRNLQISQNVTEEKDDN